MQEIHRPEHVGKLSGKTLEDWRPEDKTFWESTAGRIARRNLAISIPAVVAVVRRLDGVVGRRGQAAVDRLPLHHRPLFWLAALPGVTGATLRIFYSFTVRSSAGGCGRRW